MPIYEFDGELDDATAIGLAQERAAQESAGGAMSGGLRGILQALAPAFAAAEPVTPTMPAIRGRDVVGLGLQGVQKVQDQAQQSTQDMVMQQLQARKERADAIELEKDRGQQLKLETMKAKNDMAAAKLQAELEGGLIQKRADADVDVATRTGQTAQTEARTEAIQTETGLAPSPEEAQAQRSMAQQAAELGLEQSRLELDLSRKYAADERAVGLLSQEQQVERQRLENQLRENQLQVQTPERLKERDDIELRLLKSDQQARNLALTHDRIGLAYVMPMLQAELDAKKRDQGQLTQRDYFQSVMKTTASLMRANDRPQIPTGRVNEQGVELTRDATDDEILDMVASVAERAVQTQNGGAVQQPQGAPSSAREFTAADGGVYRDNGDGTATRIR